ncbi:hypothetical protein INT45_005053 [Circinella minor]|uniref:F-box domain-containing protein n=1 Tax=Circinella minor TaxID=1195481 RepID=A0A8H7VPI4_9FUNG|nr:hypothetical protein INT45_005053 [Circinella minor]
MSSSSTRSSQRSALIVGNQSLLQNNPINDNNSNGNNDSNNTNSNKRKLQNDLSDNNDSIQVTTINSNNNNSNSDDNTFTITLTTTATSNNNTNKRQKKNKDGISSSSINDQVRSARHCGLPQPGLSFEIWKNICQHLPPSQLVTLAQVSVGMASIIRGLPIWKQIAKDADLGGTTTKGFRQTFYGVVVSISERVCERCFKKSKPTGCYASLKIYDTQNGYPIHLCFPCRKTYYTKYPESYDPSRDSAVQRPAYYLKLATQYGGRVGYEEVLRKRREISKTRNMNEKSRRDQRQNALVEKLEEHEIWYDKTSDPFTNYVVDGKPDLETTLYVLTEVAATRHERQARTDLVKERLARMNLEDHYLFGLEAVQFVKSGVPPLDELMEMIKAHAQVKQIRKGRRRVLMDRLQALVQLNEADVNSYIESKECQGYWLYGRQNLDEIIRRIAQRVDEQKIAKESRESRRQKIMNLLHDRREELENVSWYLNEERLSEYAVYQWMDINGIIRKIKYDAGQEERETRRRQELEQRLRGCGLDFDKNKSDYLEYISRGRGSVDEIVASSVEWDWVLRETKEGFNNHYKMNQNNRIDCVARALAEYISNRLMNLELGSPRNEPCTLSRPPSSLWNQIDRITPEEWRKHAKKCMVDGLLLNDDATETILHGILSNQYAAIITNQMLSTAMNRGAAFIASNTATSHIPLNNNHSFVPVSSSSTTTTTTTAVTQVAELNSSPAIPLFSVALRDMLGGEENFDNFLEGSRAEIIRLVRTKLL